MRDREKNSTISMGVGAVVFRGNEVLIVKRGKPPFEGHWSIPGGGLEFGERITDAVRREVREETSIEIEILGLLDVFEGLPDDQEFGGHIIMVDYVAEWRAGKPMAGDDAVEAEFVSIDKALARLSWDKTRQAIQRALKIRNDFKERPQ